MGAELLGLEWLNANATRNYPLAFHATGLDTSGDFTLPNDLLLALYLPVPTAVEVLPDRFFISSIVADSFGIALTVGYDDGSNNPPAVASVAIARSTHTEYRSYPLLGLDDFEDVVGKVVLGTFDGLNEQPAGKFTFEAEGGALDPDCIRPHIRGVSSLQILNGTEVSERWYGDTIFIAGRNQRIVGSVDDNSVTSIRFDAISGEGLNERCDCPGGGPEAGASPFRFLNGVPPGMGGDGVLIGDRCTSFEAVEGGLRVTNRCSNPCASCSDLQPLLTDIIKAKDGVKTIDLRLQRMEAAIAAFKDTLFGGMLSDRNCETC